MKKLTALITVIAVLFSMALPVWADDGYVAVSIGKPIEVQDDSEIHSSRTPEKANDGDETTNVGDTSTYFQGHKNVESNALKIDLEKDFILSYVSVTMDRYSERKVYLSANDSFTGGIELTEDPDDDTRFNIPAGNENNTFRYVILTFKPDPNNHARIKDIQAYTTPENANGAGAQIFRPEEFTEETIKISEGKSAVSKCYGTGGYASVAANAVDGDTATQFISCAQRDVIEWMTIDLGEAEIISKIETIFTATRTYAMYATNTAYGQSQEIEDGVQLNETSDGSKVFVLPDEYKSTPFRYVRLRFNGDADNITGSSEEQNVRIYDFSIYKSTRDIIYNAAAEKSGALTDGDTETAITVANNKIIDLLTPTYIHSYELLGSDKDDVTIKGSLFKTTVDNMEEIPQSTTENKKYRFIAIESNSGEAVSLNEVKVWSFFTDVVTPWTKNGKNCSVTVTNTSHNAERRYTFSATAYDEYGAVMGVKTVTEALANGVSKTVNLEVDGADLAKRVVCTVERDGKLVSSPAIYVDGVKETVPNGTPYTTAPEKDFETAVAKTDYFDGLELAVSNTGGIENSDILTFSVYNSANELLAKDAVFANGTFKYRLPGDADAGEYKAVLAANDAMGNSTKIAYPFTKVAPTQEEVNDAIADFAAATTAEAFADAYDTHYVTNGTISFSDIPEAEALLASGIGVSFIKMWSARNLWKNNPSETFTAEDIRDCMKAAVVENALENKRTNAATVLTKYASVLDNVFDGNQNNTYTAEIFKTGATDNEKLIYNMKIAAALSQIKNAESEVVENILRTYKDILSVDLDTISESGVELLLVARRLDKTIPETYKDGLKDEIDQILLNNTPEGEGDEGDDDDDVGGGSVGGGGYTGERTDVIVKDDYPLPTEAPEEEIEQVSFDDVADNYWAAESIIKLATAGILSGRGDGTYDPESAVSRAEYTTMLVKAFKLISDPEEKPEFTDCKVSDWFYPFVDAAVSNNIVSGISKTEFAPAASISRQDACVMSYQMMIYKNYLKYFAGKTFTDSDKVAAYAQDAVNMLSGSGVISGFVDGSFGPKELLSRAQAAVIIDKLMTLLGEEV